MPLRRVATVFNTDSAFPRDLCSTISNVRRPHAMTSITSPRQSLVNSGTGIWPFVIFIYSQSSPGGGGGCAPFTADFNKREGRLADSTVLK